LSAIRYASLPELVRSLRQEVRVWGAEDIGAAPERLGLKGSPTSVKQIFAPPVRGGGLVFDTGESQEQAVDDFLGTFFEKEAGVMKELWGEDKG